MGANFRDKFLTYNDDIQGTASVAMAALLGAVKLQKPNCTDLVAELRKMRVLFHGAGSANLGGASLIIQEGKMPRDQVIVTNSKGVIWKSADGSQGSGKNDEQKALAQTSTPNCFTKEVVEAMLEVQDAKPPGQRMRPVLFALSNPKSQAEITAKDCYAY